MGGGLFACTSGLRVFEGRPNGRSMVKWDEPTFFATPKDLRAWLAKRHEQRAELVMGFWKVGSGKASVTWPQAIEEAVAFGWIDGVRHSLDAESYTVRFTPRKRTSAWSKVNIATDGGLVADGRMAPAGLRASAA